MTIKKILKKMLTGGIRFTLISMSFFTLTFSELAKAKEAEKFTTARVAAAVKDLGLDKDMTFGEFYKKNKNLFPKHVQAELEPYLKNSSHFVMPKFIVTSAQSSGGEAVPKVSTEVGGKLINIQFLGDSDKFIKFQNTTLSKVDVINFKDMMAKIWHGDESLRKTAMPFVNQNIKSQKKFGTFSGFPAVSYEAWKKLSKEQRAAYLVNMRLMYIDALRVNLAFAKKGKKTVQFPYLEKLFQTVFGEESFAASKNRTPRPAPISTVADPRYEGQCVVAGYIGSYADNLPDIQGKRGCSVDTAIKRSTSEYVVKANSICSDNGRSRRVACNPLIYGYETTSKNPICIERDETFQIATHFEGPCDTKSRLTSEGFKETIPFYENEKYDTSLTAHEDQKQKVLADAESADQTARYLKSVLNADGKGDLAALLTGNGLTKENFEKLKAEIEVIRVRFDQEIKTAIGSCEAQVNTAIDAKKPVPAEQRLACDQLHRRYLNIDGVLKRLHLPEQITPPPGPTPQPPQPPVGPGVDCDTKYPGAGTEVGASGQCVCPVGTRLAKVGVGPDNAEAWECQGAGGKPGKPSVGGNDCGFLCKLWGWVKPIIPLALAAVGIYAIYRVMMPKKPTLNPAGDLCPDGSVANPTCRNYCGTYQVALPAGGCGCPPCGATGQVTIDFAKCTCGSGSGDGTNPTTFTCADGVTKVTDQSQCPPAALFTCPDGSKVPNQISCPVKNNAAPTTGTGIDKNGTGR